MGVCKAVTKEMRMLGREEWATLQRNARKLSIVYSNEVSDCFARNDIQILHSVQYALHAQVL